jgi:uncharacterized membrane protein YgcG
LKKLNFNRSVSSLRNLEDVKKPRKKINWDKIIYFLVLGLIIFFFLKYAVANVFYVEAPGQVYFNSVKVRLPKDATIQNFKVLEGDTVAIGDTLFTYVSEQNGGSGFNGVSISGLGSSSSGSGWQEREIYQLQKNIELTRLKAIENINLINWNQQQIKDLEGQVILEVTSKTVIEKFRKDVNKLELDNKKYWTEIEVYKKLIKELGGQAKSSSNTGNVSVSGGNTGGSVSGFNSYVSPMKGTVTRIYKNDYEVALKSEDILNLHKRERIYIKAFFDQEDFQYLKQDTEVTVKFPDGSESTGAINRFYFATYRVPPEFQKKYEPITRTIAVDIYPIKNSDQIKWKAFYKMGVTIKASKY